MKELWRRYKVAIIAGGLVISMTAALGAGMGLLDKLVLGDVVRAADEEMDGPQITKIYYEQWDTKVPYKEYNQDGEIVRQVCEKYGLDYDTVTLEEITSEMFSYEEALYLLKNSGDVPLYESDTKDGSDGIIQSLEFHICEIYAFSGGKTVIGDYCRAHGINPEEAVVSDLTADDLVAIQNKAFETSEHGTEEESKKTGDRLYKDYQLDKKIAKQVCKEYNLDYDTVKVKEITGEKLAYQEALWLFKFFGSSPLYEENAEREGYKIVECSLEAHIRDTNNLKDARNAIGEFCRKRGIDPDTAVISDFSIDDLTEMINTVIETSEHKQE